ncbi:DUF883 family protein [Rheinheimera faecalis]|jgi:ElaB/YqjD/DUF883 family membrane-anchored ribosome-binding protein|uniref:DUF883 family protein n=1 Tax=Rheinheimera faecalis TaxID=2901141 RepID=UPI001E43F7CE|nr:DUF883 family protein [Rheinheimera faecalis]
MPTRTDGAAPNSSQSGPALTDEFHNFIADIEDLLKTTTSLTGAEFEQAKKKLTERVATAKASVEDIGHNFAAKARHSAEVTDRYVHQQPWQSIAACAAVSFVLGVFVARCSGSGSK